MPDACLPGLAEMGLSRQTFTFRHRLSRPRSALALAGDAPDHIADIVRDQKRTVGTEGYPDRPSIGLALVRCEEARQDIARRTCRASVRERHEDDLVTAQRAAIPGAVLPDR